MNLLDLYFEYARTSCDAPWGYHRVVGLMVAGDRMGAIRWIQWGTEPLYPNMYLCLVGPSGIRKTTALKCGVNVMNVRPLFYSEESEFSVACKTPTLRMELVREWDGCRKNIITAVSLDWFDDNVCKKNLRESFLSRFFYAVETKQENIYPMPPKVNEILLDELSKTPLLEGVKAGVMSLTPESEKFYSDWAKGLIERAETYPKLMPVFKRLPVYCLKFAMIMQTVKDGSFKISVEVMTEAIKLVDYYYDKARNTLLAIKLRPEKKMEELENRVMKMLWENPYHEMGLNQISVKLRHHIHEGRNRTPIVHAVFERLIEKGLITKSKKWTSAQAWKKATIYALTKKEVKE